MTAGPDGPFESPHPETASAAAAASAQRRLRRDVVTSKATYCFRIVFTFTCGHMMS